MATMLLRAAFMYRMGVDEAADVAPPTQVGVWEDLKVRFDKFWWAAGEGSAICVLLFVSVGISIGLLTTVLSVTASLLTTANYGVIGYPTERDVFEAALTVRPEASVDQSFCLSLTPIFRSSSSGARSSAASARWAYRASATTRITFLWARTPCSWPPSHWSGPEAGSPSTSSSRRRCAESRWGRRGLAGR